MNKRLILLGFLLIQCSIISFSQIKNDAGSANKIDECAKVFTGLECDVSLFSCPLNYAIASGSYPCVKQIADREGVPYIQTKTYPPAAIPIINAVLSGRLEIVNLLYGYNSDLEIKDVVFEKTPLRWASTMIQPPYTTDSAYLQIMDFLIKKGADIDAIDKWGETALIENARLGRYEYVKLLIDNGANLNITNGKGATALMTSTDNQKILTLLARANVMIRDQNGRTAIFYAIERCQPNKFKMLLARNRDLLKMPDRDGYLPSEFANKLGLQNNCPEIAVQLNAK
ncbi:MAG: ankyrin repeat domain-containing protein [Acidobacteria bacterium]|nr:ankyrin repeat domain-containing protein [Acidobacteriota bacterium]